MRVGFDGQEAAMGLTTATSEHSSHAEKIRQLRLQLAETADEQKRHKILRQIEALEEESKSQLR